MYNMTKYDITSYSTANHQIGITGRQLRAHVGQASSACMAVRHRLGTSGVPAMVCIFALCIRNMYAAN